MLRSLFVCFACFAVLLLVSCSTKTAEKDNELLIDNSFFEIGKVLCSFKNDSVEEASGLADSKANPGLLWTHNDSGGEPRIFLIDKEGNVKSTVRLDSARNRDWEDISIGPGPVEGKTYLYIADIGDNESEHNKKYIYRIEEPVIDVTRVKDTTIQDVEIIKFNYPDGSRDAESFMIDPLTRDLFIISKRELRANLYRLPYPQSTSEMITAEISARGLEFDKMATVDTIRENGEVLVRGYHPKYFYQIVAADISADGSEVLIKSYSTVYYWKRGPGETIVDLLQRPAVVLPYDPEPQGEAIAFDREGKGFYTLNEKMRGMEQKLTFYKRK